MNNTEELDALKSNPGVLRVYARYVSLKKTGDKYVGKCPLLEHSDSSPSFTVFSDMRASCFGCGANLNIFQLIQKIDGCDFKTAVAKVKAEVGDTSWEDSRRKVESTFKPIAESKVYKTITLDAWRKLEDNLLASKSAQDFLLKERGIKLKTAQQLKLGFVQNLGSLAGADGADIADKGWLAFPSIEDGKVISVKYRSIVRKKPGGFSRQPGMATALFNTGTISPFDPVYVTEGECFSGDTEVLTPEGWVRLDGYSGQKVAQWDVDGSASYTKPYAYVNKEYSGKMLNFTSNLSGHIRKPVVDLLVTPRHRMVYLNPMEKENYSGVRVGLAENLPKSIRVFRACKLETSGIQWSEDEIRLQCAIQADASLESCAEYKGTDGNGLDRWRAEFSKERKIVRLRSLLTKMGMKFTEYPLIKKDTVLFRFNTPPGRYKKVFPKEFYQMNLVQRSIFLDEVPYWDGTRYLGTGSYKFNSTIEQNADVVQWAAVTSDFTARKYVDPKLPPRSDSYGVIWGGRTKRGHQILSCGVVTWVETEFSGRVYCVSVPTGFLLVRRNGLVVVSGNCDALVLEQAGFKAVSVPSAGAKLTPEMKDKLIQASIVILVGDTDAAGTASMDKLWKELSERCFKLTWPDGAKDANQCFLDICGRDVAQFTALVEDLTRKAKAQPMPSVYSLQETMLNGEQVSLSEHPDRLRFPWASVDTMANVMPGDILGIGSTNTGMAKTTLVVQLTMHNARKYGRCILNFQTEMRPDEIATMATAQILRKDRNFLTAEDKRLAAEELEGVQYYVGCDPQLTDINAVLDLLEAAIKRLSPYCVVLDHFHHLTTGMDNETRVQAAAMTRIKQIAQTYGVVFINVGQPRKATQQAKGKQIHITDFKGSGAWGDAANAVMAIHRDLNKSDDPTTSKGVYEDKSLIKLLKGRSMGTGASACYLTFFGEFASFEQIENNYDEPSE